MKEEIGRLVKHAGIYGVGVVLTKSVGFLLIPLYTRFLTPADYGVLELLDLTLFFSGIFCMMGISAAVFRFYAAYESETDRKEVISTALFFVIAVSLLVAIALQFLAAPLAATAFGNAGYAPYVRIVAWTLFFSNLTEVPFAYWRARQRTVRFVVVSLIRTAVSAGTLVLAVAVLHQGVRGVVYANLITNGLLGLIMLGITLGEVGFRVARHKLREMLKYGAPLIVQSLASFVLVFSDRLFLRHFANLAEVGVYSLGYKLAGIVSLLVSGPFSMTWSWQQFELAKKDNARNMYARIQTYQLVVSVCVGLAVAIMAKDALRVMTPQSYWAATRIVPLIVLCYILDNIKAVVLSGILIQRVTHYLAAISVVAAVANLTLNYVLISRYHAMGAALATVLSYAFLLALAFLVAQRVYYVRYEYLRNAAVLALATLIYITSTFVDLRLFPSIAVNLALFLLFPIVTVMMLGREERAMFLQLGAKAAHRLFGRSPVGQS